MLSIRARGFGEIWRSCGRGLVRMGGILLLIATGPPPSAQAASLLWNDGLVHAVADSSFATTSLTVRNEGCGSELEPGADCLSPGASTGVRIEVGADVLSALLRDFSWLSMDGGALSGLSPFDRSTIVLGGGSVASPLMARDFTTLSISGGSVNGGRSGGRVGIGLEAAGASSITLTGGSIGGDLYADGTATLTIVGHDFTLNGSPLAYGQLPGNQGTLAGTLDSGDALDNRFYQQRGRIVLAASAPAPLPVANVVLNDAGSYVAADWAYSRSAVHVRNLGCGDPGAPDAPCASPGPPTQLELATDGAAGSLSVHDASSATLSGGLVGVRLTVVDTASVDLLSGDATRIEARGDSIVTVAGAVTSTAELYDSSTFRLSSGGTHFGLYAHDSAQVVLTGGFQRRFFKIYDQSMAEISGGSHGSTLEAFDTSSFSLSGGSLNGTLLKSFSTGLLSGGTSTRLELREASAAALVGGLLQNASATPGQIFAYGAAQLTIVGQDFAVDGVPTGYGPVDATSGTLAGVLQSGDPLAANFVRSGGRIVLSASAPTPASSVQVLLNDADAWSLSDWGNARDRLFVRNLGCGNDVNPAAACAAPGPSTSLALATGGAVASVGVFDDSSLSLDGGVVGLDVDVYDTAFALLDGSQVWGELRAHDNALIRVESGEAFSNLEAHDSAQLDLRGGVMEDVYVDGAATLALGGSSEVYSIDARGDARVAVTGGTVEDEVDLYDRAFLQISRGQLLYDVYLYDQSQIAVRGGLLDGGLVVEQMATAVVSGGILGSTLDVRDHGQASLTGGAVPGLTARDWASISVVGSGFALDGQPVGYGPLSAETGQLTGTLQSGDPLNASIGRDPTAAIQLVPEPSVLLLQLGALFTLGACRGRGRRDGDAARLAACAV